MNIGWKIAEKIIFIYERNTLNVISLETNAIE